VARKIRSLDQLPAKKRPGSKQIASARAVKRVEANPRLIRRRRGRKEIELGQIPARDVAGTIKDFRLTYKEDLAALLKDENGNVFARTYFASARTSIPETLVIKALSKYGYSNNAPVNLSVISFEDYKSTKAEKVKEAKQKAKADRTPRKASKKPAKKETKKPVQKTPKKSVEKVKRLSPTNKMAKRVAELEKEWRRKDRQLKKGKKK
jgi:hypothetical protein